MTDTTHEAPDDLMTRLKDRLKALYDDSSEYSPGQISEASVMALTRIKELEAKLAQQDDLVQAAVERGFWAGRSCGGSKAEIDAALNALCQGGE